LVPESRTLTINGTTQDLSADRTFTISTGIIIGTTAITSGTNGRFLFDNGGVVSETNGAFWDNTNSIFDVKGNIRISKSTYSSILAFNSGAFGSTSSYFDLAYPINGGLRYIPNFGASFDGAAFQCFGGTEPFYAGQMYFDYGSQARNISGRSANWRNASLAGVTNVLTLTANSNVLINTTTDAGFKLDVNGTARVVGQLTANANIVQTANTSSITAGYEGGFVLTGGVGSLKRDTTGYLKTLLDCGYDGGLRIRPYSAGFTSYVDVRSDTSAVLTVTSTNQGFLPPRMTTTQKNAIASPAEGLQVWDTTLKLMSVYNGTTWITL
jgi:hypothetical protein